MYRVSGSGYRFKPPQSGSGGSWAGGPLVESHTSDSYLGHPPRTTGDEPGGAPVDDDPSASYGRSPVCRLLEQTQYVATPTEDEHRPRPSGPPAFTSPAYFLPALAWLRLPLLRHTWPGGDGGTSNNNSGGGGSGSGSGAGPGAARDTTRYNAARPVHCDCGETTHQWRPREEKGGQQTWGAEEEEEEEEEDPLHNHDDEPEYSEIAEGHQYSELNPSPPLESPSNGLGPYEYEMQERTHGQERQQPRHPQHHYRQHHHRQHHHRPKSRQAPGHEHRYEKLWPCGSARRDGACLAPRNLSSSTPGTCENGWLSRYRLPSPIMPASDPPCRRLTIPDHVLEGAGGGGGATADDLTSDTELLPSEAVMSMVTSGGGRRSQGQRSEMKYPNPAYEGWSRRTPPPVSSPLLSRLWGYLSWNKR